MKTQQELTNLLNRIDGKGYKAYKDLKGQYKVGGMILALDAIQGDPFASPSRARIILNQESAAIPEKYFDTPEKKTAVVDYLARNFSKAIRSIYGFNKDMGTGKSGLIRIDPCGQEILDRTAIKVSKSTIEARVEIGLPAAGRRVLGDKAKKMLVEVLPKIADKALKMKNINKEALKKQVELVEDQCYLRREMARNNLIAFINNGAILPRKSGVSNEPMVKDVIPFKSPKSMEVTFELPHRGTITGMGIKEGVTIIVGGGYHGKSTLLNALERGVYNHIEKDGRELVLTHPDSMKIRAEDGRFINNVNVSKFINNLPNKKPTDRFYSENASGSTSQAANIIEALEIGAKLLLIDEDTSATNFMIRDDKMKQLIQSDKEPITPFIDRVRDLYEEEGVSTILVVGGAGDYFKVADSVIMMDEYMPKEVTAQAKKIIENEKKESYRVNENKDNVLNRNVSQPVLSSHNNRLKVKTNGLRTIIYDRQEIDLSYVEQLVDPSQTRAMAMILKYITNQKGIKAKTINDLVSIIDHKIKTEGLDSISEYKGHPGFLAYPRKFEVAATLNRFRGLILK